MDNQSNYKIEVNAETNYLEDQSDPDKGRFVFAYTITIANQGDIPARLLTRHWVITDANGKVQEVHGEGVVGETPYLRPGEHYQYTSGTLLETEVGHMEGSYQMVADDGHYFDANVPAFVLAAPRTLH